MQEQLLHFDISSPFDLKQAKEKDATRFAELRLYGPNILARQFSVPSSTSVAALGNILKLESAEVLSLEPDKVELDYCISHRLEGNTKGLFIALSGTLLQEYMRSFNKTDIIPVKMTAQVIARLSEFLSTHKIKTGNFCLLDLFKADIINMSVFIDGRCEFIRAIHYDTESYAEQEIINSLRYTCSRSSSKQLCELHFSGDLTDREDFISGLREKIELSPKSDKPAENALSPNYQDLFLDLNLLKKHSVSLPIHNKIVKAQKLLLAGLLAICLLLALASASKKSKINKLSSSFKMSNYNYALSLQQKIKALGNER